MILFFTRVVDHSKFTLIIPTEKLDSIRQFGATIEIWYRNGEMIRTEPEDRPNYVEQQDILTLKYISEQMAVEDLQNFYSACKNNHGAFCFAAMY